MRSGRRTKRAGCCLEAGDAAARGPKAAQAQVWTIRKVGLGLIMSCPPIHQRPYSFIEDMPAVPVARLAEFVGEMERILAQHGVQGEVQTPGTLQRAACTSARSVLKTVDGVRLLLRQPLDGGGRADLPAGRLDPAASTAMAWARQRRNRGCSAPRSAVEAFRLLKRLPRCTTCSTRARWSPRRRLKPRWASWTSTCVFGADYRAEGVEAGDATSRARAD